MEKYKLNYEIKEDGASIQLLQVYPSCNYIWDSFYEGRILKQIYLEDNGVYELSVVHVFEEDYDHFGIVSLEKIYGS